MLLSDKLLSNSLMDGITVAPWIAPSDWINIDNCADGNINLLVADTTMATYAFICTTSSGQYHIDWGDGTSGNFDSGATAQHTYTVGAGQVCSRGYTTFKIVISPVSGNLTSFAVTSHSLATQNQAHHILSCVFNAINITTLANAFYKATSPIVSCGLLESFNVKELLLSCLTTSYMFFNCYSLQSVNISSMESVTTTSYMFFSCHKLQNIDISSMVSVITVSSMFSNCYSLQNIDISSMVSVTNASSMFSNCRNLQSVNISSMVSVIDTSSMFSNCYNLLNIDISSMVSVTNASSMFNSCYNLLNIDISSMVSVTNASSMFNSCYNLSSLITTNFALNSSSIIATTMFDYCEQLTSINLSNAKVSKLGLKGTSGKLNKVATLIFHASSTFSDATAPQLDLQYTALTAAQLDTIFTSLPTVTSKTVNITGSTGAATCTRTIATGKGWTVTG